MQKEIKYAVITENDKSAWDDQTGSRYHFPKRYLKFLPTGTKVIYYKGGIKDKAFANSRKSEFPHYFGVARIGQIIPDRASSKGDFYAIIDDFIEFDNAIVAKESGAYIEKIPQNRKTNYWRDGVRQIEQVIYDEIISLAGISDLSASRQKQSAHDAEYSLESGKEGRSSTRFVTTYERNPQLRRAAIDHHGSSCKVCGFNFGETYGDYAVGYIQVHHVNPISEAGGEIEVSPETDLVPLCANCHAVVHRRQKMTLSIDELITMLSEQRARRD